MEAPIFHPTTKKKIELLLNDPPQAVGIVGEPKSGKGFVAKYIAAKLLGLELPDLAKYPYCLRYDVESEKFGIDEIRDLQKALSIKVPRRASINRVVVLEHIHALGHEAQNALLKTLEEPPSHTSIVVTFNHPASVLETVRSRLQEIQVLAVSEAVAKEMLSSYEAAELEQAYAISGGRVGLMTALLGESDDLRTGPAISLAKEILTKSKYDRLCMVDALIKKPEIPVSDLLESIRIVLNATFQNSVKGTNSSQQQASLHRLSRVYDAIQDNQRGANQKLTLSRLFAAL